MLDKKICEKAKALAEKQYFEGLENDFRDTIGFDFEGQWIVYPWLDPSARFPLDDIEAADLYGEANFENFCRAIVRDDSAKKVQGYDNSLPEHTGII